MRIPIACIIATIAAPLLGVSGLQADVIVTADGSRLHGQITGAEDGVISLKTSYAGTIEIKQVEVVSFSSDEPLVLRLNSGTVMSGEVQEAPNSAIYMENEDGSLTTSTDRISAVWRPGDRDPAALAREMALEGQMRKWTYQAGVDISGKSGNTDQSTIGLRASAVLEGPNDRLRIYGSYSRAEQEGIETSDETIGGLDFTSFFTERWGWYLKEEIELDEFENIDFRSTTSGGISRRFVNREDLRWEGRAGLSYRYEDYSDATDSEGYPGMEFATLFYWKFARWGELNTEISYVPAFEDLGNYRITQKSNLDFPLAVSDQWKLRLGLSNDYTSEPAPGQEELDTTYTVSLLLNWK